MTSVFVAVYERRIHNSGKGYILAYLGVFTTRDKAVEACKNYEALDPNRKGWTYVQEFILDRPTNFD